MREAGTEQMLSPRSRRKGSWGRRSPACCAWTQLLVLLLNWTCAPTRARKLADIRWHSNNTIFDISNTDHVKRVHLLDRVTLLCPPPSGDYEHSKLFMVPRESYEQCLLQDERQLGVCSSPERQSSITLVFRDVSPLPSALTFRPGQSYFLITTSNGTAEGLNNTEGGLCASRNMRLKFDVMPSSSGTEAEEEDSPTGTAHPRHPHKHKHHRQHQQRAHNSQNQPSPTEKHPPFLYVIHTMDTPQEVDGEEAAAWGQEQYGSEQRHQQEGAGEQNAVPSSTVQIPLSSIVLLLSPLLLPLLRIGVTN